jgi:hypothetical protein
LKLGTYYFLGLNPSNKNIMEKLEAIGNEQSIQSLKIDRLLLKMDNISQALKNKNDLINHFSI